MSDAADIARIKHRIAEMQAILDEQRIVLAGLTDQNKRDRLAGQLACGASQIEGLKLKLQYDFGVYY